MEIHLILIITFFAIIQSVFGMGLLVFGTPTLLLMEYSFSDVLSILLPPSLTVSTIQFLQQDKPKKGFILDLLKFCLPVLVLVMAWTFIHDLNVNLYLLIATILIFTAISRFSATISGYSQAFIEKNSRRYLVIMGCVHGLSNMGGSLLSTYAVSRHQHKKDVLGCIVTGYLLFGIVQLCTMSYINVLNLNKTSIVTCIVSAAAYLLIGNRIYKSINDTFYQHIFSGFMLIYAALMIFS